MLEPRLPAIAISPHSANETTMPTIETIVACQNEMPKPSTNDPYDTPNTETLAANHGQNRSRGFAVRSDSGMISMPARSISAGPSSIFSDTPPYWHRGHRMASHLRIRPRRTPPPDASEVVQVADASELARRVHRQDRDADIHRADAEAGGGDRADRRPARHGVVRDELLRGDASRFAPFGPGGRSHGVGRIALVRVDLEDRSGPQQRLDDGIVLMRIVRMHRVPDVARQMPGGRERTALAPWHPLRARRRRAPGCSSRKGPAAPDRDAEPSSS